METAVDISDKPLKRKEIKEDTKKTNVSKRIPGCSYRKPNNIHSQSISSVNHKEFRHQIGQTRKMNFNERMPYQTEAENRRKIRRQMEDTKKTNVSKRIPGCSYRKPNNIHSQSISSVNHKEFRHQIGQTRKMNFNERMPYQTEVENRRKIRRQMVSDIREAQQILGSAKPMDQEEAALEKLIFGCDPEDLEDKEDLDQKPNQGIKPAAKNKESQAAWEDEDDDHLLVKTKAESLKKCHRSISTRGEEKYADFVQEKFNKIMGTPKWAEIGRISDKDSDDESDDLLTRTGNFIQKSDSLPQGNIYISKCPSLADSSMKSSVVKSIEFHPTSKVALVASTNGTVNLFQIDGKINAKIQSICFENFYIETSHFTLDGKEIVVGSRYQAHMFSYDMFAGKITKIPEIKELNQKNVRKFQMSPDGNYIVINGRYGCIHLMTTKSKEWVGTLKMNGEVIAITFNGDGTMMYSHGASGEVYVWDMSSRKCIHKFADLGCINGTSIAISPNEQFLTTGSDSGIVNIYDHKTALTSLMPEPVKFLKNLTTEVSSLKFNSTSELLAVSSHWKEDAVKLVHFPSFKVFSNFPMLKEGFMLKRPNSIAFSPNSGYFSIGNNFGTAYIFRLKHYQNY